MSKHAVIKLVSHADERRQALIQAAYQRVAEQGLKGLRTREVAAQVGITHATLHYYFPTKAALIQALIEYAVFKRLLINVPRYEGHTPQEQIHQFVTGLLDHMQTDPNDFLVLYELVRNARNEPAIRQVFSKQEIFGDWHQHLTSLLEAGIAQGQFRADLDPLSAASVLMTFILGLGMTTLIPLPVSAETMVTQIERWLSVNKKDEEE